MPSFYEFFAGGGMARAGLGKNWDCLFANEIDGKKAVAYSANWGGQNLKIKDVAELKSSEVPGNADLSWASFPCQDLSLAGDYTGLKGNRSGTFWPFWRLMNKLMKENRAPSIIVLENVCGALTSHDRKDFAALGAAFAESNYRFGGLVVNAVRFVPQSRPRLFMIGIAGDRNIPKGLTIYEPNPQWHPDSLVESFQALPEWSKRSWHWWDLPSPPPRKSTFSEIIDKKPDGVAWHTDAETMRLLSLMNPLHWKKVEEAMGTKKPVVGGIYKRTRINENGERIQRAEIRFDDVAGCLRTPIGGSSRQFIMVIHGNSVRSRLLSPREAARLMGLPESYKLPGKYNEAYHLIGDGVVVPVVRFLAEHIIEPLLETRTANYREAA